MFLTYAKETYIRFLFGSVALYYLAGLLSIMTLSLENGSNALKRTESVLFLAGCSAFLSHSTYLTMRGIISGHAPLANLHETLSFFAWCLAFINIVSHIQYKKTALNCLNHMLILILVTVSFLSERKLTPLYPVLDTVWFELHVSSAFIAYGFFTVSTVASLSAIIYSKTDDFILFDELTEKCARWGLLVFSISTVTGGIWAFLAWSDYWIWTPKEIWTVILWLYYTTYLHLRLKKKWSGRPINIFAAFGLVVMLFTYLGVSILMQSSHNM